MDFYKHLHPDLTREQQETYVRLGRHLVFLDQDATWDPAAEFDAADEALDLTTGDPIPITEVAAHRGPLACNLLGHAVRALIKPEPGEDWPAYQIRILGAAYDSPLEDWLVSSLWRGTDNTATGAALRLMYVLDYGVPVDFEAIRNGDAESDYRTNGFLWDRLDLMPTQDSAR